jgi:hypothetical protein
VRARVQQLAARAGQVVEVASTEYASVASGDAPRSSDRDTRRSGSKRKAAGAGNGTHSSSNEAGEGVGQRGADDDEAALAWKVEVVGLQLALLSAARLGTAQFAAERCTLCHSALATSVTLEVSSLAFLRKVMQCLADSQESAAV